MIEISISVHNLVEFVLRHGDIDNRHVSRDALVAMQEGSRMHRMLQEHGGADYSSEVPLWYTYETKEYAITVEGRADGIIEDLYGVTIDEIKTTYRNVMHLREPEEIHLAQAKCYAYMYASDHYLDNIGVQLTYCNLKTCEIRRFNEDYTFNELSEWFDNLMKEYGKWAEFEYKWKEQRQSSIHKLEFPFEYRDGQKLLAAYVYNTINNEKNIFIEAPTGVGKTVTTLFPAIKAMGEGKGNRIFYLTAKTITRTVAMNTLNILGEKGLRFKTVMLTAKDKICILDEPECNPVMCVRAKGHFDRINECIFEMINNENDFSREIIEEYALKYCVCPFELSLDLSLFADAIVCDYNYLFDPHVYLKRFFYEGASEEYLFLVDEAHNLLDRGRNMYSAELVKDMVLALKKDIENEIKRGFLGGQTGMYLNLIAKGLAAVNKELLVLGRKIPADKESLECTIDDLAGLLEACHRLNDEISTFFQEVDQDSEIRKEITDFYFELSHFILVESYFSEHYRAYVSENAEGQIFCKLFCMNPYKQLRECMDKGRSTALFSATLLPIQYYKSLLGGNSEDYEVYAKSVFKPEQMGLFIADDITSKYTQRGLNTYNKIADYIRTIVNVKDGNYMVFFPSYEFAYKVYSIYMEEVDLKHSCIIQKEGMNEEEREMFLNSFEAKNVIAFCVLGGIFGEGIDLTGDLLIGAIIVGNGMPKPTTEQQLLNSYFETEGKSGFDYAYCYPGMNKVLQAAGRVIRTVNDKGVVVLLESRFLEYKYQKLFPREWENQVKVNLKTIENELKSFWEMD